MTPPRDYEAEAYGAFGKRNKSPPVQTIKTRESDIVNACIRWFWAHGIKARRQNTGAHPFTYTKNDGTKNTRYVRYGKKGAGDIVMCIKSQGGRYAECECKRPGETQDPDQIAHQQEVEEQGGLYILAYGIESLEAQKDLILHGTTSSPPISSHPLNKDSA